MPVTPTYPGVYVEEIPSGVRTITGVATSITAFVGRAKRGPTDKAIKINGFADFERVFGGLWLDSTMSYAVRDFFVNGGSEAIIVRLYNPDPGAPQATPPIPTPNPKAKVAVGAIQLEAADEGKWGAYLRASVDQSNLSNDVALTMGVTKADLFNLTVRDAASGATERFVNLTVRESPRRIDRVLKDSKLVHLENDLDQTPLPTIAAADDAVTTKEKELAAAKKALLDKQIADPGNITTEQAAVATAQTALKDAYKAALDTISDGLALTLGTFLPANGEANKKGLYALEQADLFNLLCIPPYRNNNADVDVSLIAVAAAYCEKRRAMLLVDAPSDWNDKATAVTKVQRCQQRLCRNTQPQRRPLLPAHQAAESAA